MTTNNVKFKRAKNQVDKSKGMGKGYSTVTHTIDNDAYKLFEDNFKELMDYALLHGIRKPVKSRLWSMMLKRSGAVTADDYFK